MEFLRPQVNPTEFLPTQAARQRWLGSPDMKVRDARILNERGNRLSSPSLLSMPPLLLLQYDAGGAGWYHASAPLSRDISTGNHWLSYSGHDFSWSTSPSQGPEGCQAVRTPSASDHLRAAVSERPYISQSLRWNPSGTPDGRTWRRGNQPAPVLDVQNRNLKFERPLPPSVQAQMIDGVVRLVKVGGGGPSAAGASYLRKAHALIDVFPSPWSYSCVEFGCCVRECACFGAKHAMMGGCVRSTEHTNMIFVKSVSCVCCEWGKRLGTNGHRYTVYQSTLCKTTVRECASTHDG